MKTTPLLRNALGIMLALFVAPFASADQKSEIGTIPSVTKLMSKDDFHATGLDKLSKEEIALLDQWLQNFAGAVVKFASESKQPAPPARRPAGDGAIASVIETSIDGTFEGWTGKTVFKLMNGQIWQQASYSYTYHYAYMPKVMIYQSDGEWKMKVDGVSEALPVRRLK